MSDAKFMGIDTNVTRFDKKKSAPLRSNGSDIDLEPVSISVTFLGDSRYSRESATLRSDSTLD